MRSLWSIWVLAVASALPGAVESATSDTPGNETARYVIDQRDGSRVAGAIVVATWKGPGPLHAGSSCNRLETYVSAADGSFITPNDPKSGFVVVTAYKLGYEPGRPPRIARNGMDGNVDHWQVVRYRRNEDNTRGEIELIEPTIYATEESAQLASREYIDVYLQTDHKPRERRLQTLHRMKVAADCAGRTYSSDGARIYYQALYDEQAHLRDTQNELDFTQKFIDAANPRTPR